ncbi:hypothetical protein ColTof4_13598 [Colletotrichum tofieldiae]|nr:hypothetical protein ColTof3_14550 [Colletotrichum tofieldiae]GKT81175.1 hypothetical protein ColTof4_13598 [Colletotrichum tofieldiae]GKT97313.1 hypothetical protein Ct61P_15163 [Colletotrichum tofieldiae]
MMFLIVPPDAEEEWDTAEMLDAVFDKGLFTYVIRVWMCSKKRMKNSNEVPSEGAESALPMTVKRARKGVPPVRVPLEVCNMNNAGFDGEEGWF